MNGDEKTLPPVPVNDDGKVLITLTALKYFFVNYGDQSCFFSI